MKSWSFSRLAVYEQCPQRAQLQFVDRIPDPNPSKTAERGTDIHNKAELFVRGEIEHLPLELEKFKPEFLKLKDLFKQGDVILEDEWGFDTTWGHNEYRYAWLRAKCDAVIKLSEDTLLIVDYKTGKKFGNEVKHGEQLQFYAACAVARYPEIKFFSTELWYLDADDISIAQYNRTKALEALARWNERGLKATSDTVMRANPNIFSCKYCPYGSWGTGHCTKGVRV